MCEHILEPYTPDILLIASTWIGQFSVRKVGIQFKWICRSQKKIQALPYSLSVALNLCVSKHYSFGFNSYF